MKKTKTVTLLIVMLILSLLFISACLTGSGGGNTDEDQDIVIPDAVNLNDYTTALTIDYSQASQMPLTGYFSMGIGAGSSSADQARAEASGRTIKVYISADAPLRSKWVVVAVPNGVETYTFLHKAGWIALADKKGEAILALEPGENGWGTVDEEQDYINGAMTFLTSTQNGNGISVISTYSTFYFVGYEAGCAPLESWAAENPIFVISQVYIKGPGAGQVYLDTVGAKEYNGKNTGGYNPGPDDAEFIAILKQLGHDGTFITRSEVPVPVWFVGYDENDYSITYWKNANQVLAQPDSGVYRQDVNSNAWQTQFANGCILKDNPATDYGISQVIVSNLKTLSAAEIYDFLSRFIRYTNTWAYSNNLEYRLNYSEMLVAAQNQAATGVKETRSITVGGATVEYEVFAQTSTRVHAYQDPDSGTMIAGIIALDDYDSDGVLDPRDYLIYVPDNAKEIWGTDGAPVVIVHPGNTQTASVFMDCAMWWQVADDEGCVIAIVGEKYGSATSATWPTNDQSRNFDYVLADILKNTVATEYVALDFTRVYASGHSLGSRTSQTIALTDTNLFAGVATTSFPSSGSGTTGMMPSYLMQGQSDLPFMMPDLWGASMVQGWATAYFTLNGLATDIDSFNYSNTIGRFHDYMWINSQSIPLVKYTYTLVREHNCIPQESYLAWEFLKHYSFIRDTDGNVTARYYSNSGFKYADDILIVKDSEL